MERFYVQEEEYFGFFEEPKQPYDLADRFFNFAVNVIHKTRTLPERKEYNVITYQLVKAATSIGANYEESQGAVSKADFANKIGICLKEARETHYWLRMIIATLDHADQWNELEKEGGEIKKILGSIYSKVSRLKG